MNKILMVPIGVVHSSRHAVEDDNWDEEQAFVELDSSVFSAEALAGLADFSHVEILFYMNHVDPLKVEKMARHPRNNTAWPKVGIFAQRGKNRPNQIGVTICRIKKVEGLKLHLEGLDAVHGTPVLDIKPWVEEFAPRGNHKQPPWITELMLSYWSAAAEHRARPALKTNLSLEILTDLLAVSKIGPTAEMPEWARQGEFFSMSRTPEELSIVCNQSQVPDGVKAERNWRAFKVKGPLDFRLTGILASIAQPLANDEISIFAISTFDTDYILVKEENLARAIVSLRARGHIIERDLSGLLPSEIKFLRLEEPHIPLLRQWLKEPHVAEFWQETDDEEKFRRKFLNRLSERGVSPFIISFNQRPIGYIQFYEAKKVGGGWWPDAHSGTIGIDQFIGDPSLIGKGFGTKIIKQFVDELFKRPEVTEIITDPDPKNGRAIRTYEKVGFVTQGEIKTTGGPAILMKISRQASSPIT